MSHDRLTKIPPRKTTWETAEAGKKAAGAGAEDSGHYLKLKAVGELELEDSSENNSVWDSGKQGTTRRLDWGGE